MCIRDRLRGALSGKEPSAERSPQQRGVLDRKALSA